MAVKIFREYFLSVGAIVNYKMIQWRTTGAWRLSKRVVFPKQSVAPRQNEFKYLAVVS